MEDQIQSYKEQLIDAKLKNIKLTNEVQKLNNKERKQNFDRNNKKTKQTAKRRRRGGKNGRKG